VTLAVSHGRFLSLFFKFQNSFAMQQILKLPNELPLLRRPFSERPPKGSFPSLNDAQAPISPGTDPSITASTPRKRKKRTSSFNNKVSNLKTRFLRTTTTTTTTTTTAFEDPSKMMMNHLQSPARKRMRFDWSKLKGLRSDTVESDELPLMDFMDETNDTEMSSTSHQT